MNNSGIESIFKKRIQDVLSVASDVEIVSQGVTEPIRCKLSNGIDAIVKYPKNRFGNMVLANEWIGNSIADAISLSIPHYGKCKFEYSLFRDSLYDQLDDNNSGLCFFSEMIHNVVPMNDKLLLAAKNHEIERLILFDLLVSDRDRHNGNIICSLNSDIELVFIDCSHIYSDEKYSLSRELNLNMELSSSNLYNIAILEDGSNDNVYNRLCECVGYKDEVLFNEADRIREILTDSVLDYIKASIPCEWMSIREKDRTEAIFLIIKKKIKELYTIAKLVSSDRRIGKWRK